LLTKLDKIRASTEAEGTDASDHGGS
jgi:hypothetical protein